MPARVHIAGYAVKMRLGPGVTRGRQLCAWCGAVLLEFDRTATEMAATGPRPWEIGSLVALDGAVAYTVTHREGDPLPQECCAPTTATPKVRRVLLPYAERSKNVPRSRSRPGPRPHLTLVPKVPKGG